MAIGSGDFPILGAIEGIKIGTVSAGIKTPGRKDLVVFQINETASIAAIFTQNVFCAAPVQIARKHLATGIQSRYLLINTGNANAGMGEEGIKDTLKTCRALADEVGVDIAAVLPFSTGVIGEKLPVEKIVAEIPQALDSLVSDGWELAAEGIMTTDTRPKAACFSFRFQGKKITVIGIAKGAGMIKPNMATMLGYLATDARVEPKLLQSMFEGCADRSFNRITVDGDTSTNDACILIATGAVENDTIESKDDTLYAPLEEAIERVCLQLAQGLIKDAEGASKFVAVVVEGGLSIDESLMVAYTVAESPLVKTALFASDPNWGRVLAAIGRAGVDSLNVNNVALYLNDILIAERGQRAESYTEEQGSTAMAEEEISIRIELNRGQESATVWTSDLSNEYVRINAEYRT
jgi:glutamate N-acetyltransferase/amino-acid N-acetyltransferase